MSNRVHLHPDMYHLAEGNEIIETTGKKTVGECIDYIIDLYPDLHDVFYYKDGSLQSFIEIYVNKKAVIPNEPAYEIKDGDEIHLSMTIAGG